MEDYTYERDPDGSSLWIKGPPRASLSVVAKIRRWLLPALACVVILGLIIAVACSNTKMSSRLWSVEKRVSNLSDVIQSLNNSLQQAQETAKEVQRLQFSVENNKDQLSSVSEALKQLSVVNSLSKSVEYLKCSLEHFIRNSSTTGGCCPLGWDVFDGTCYYFSIQTMSWSDSKNWCEKEGSHLVILKNDKQWDFVIPRAHSNLYWVGLTDGRTGRWEWVNETPYVMERRRWQPGQPDGRAGHGLGGNEDCAHLHFSGRLNDGHCSQQMRYICQKSSLQG